MFFILNHYSRNASPIREALEGQGAQVSVYTDATDFYQLPKNHVKRYSGIQRNYRNIIEAETQDEWKVIMHDDVSIPDGLVSKINYILKSAPDGVISFYVPTNQTYKKLAESNKHVLRTYNNFWVQCHAIKTSTAKRFAGWCDERVSPVGYLAEDGLIKSFTSHTSTPAYVIFPSLIQHEGYAKSTFKNPAKLQYWRYSEFYRPNFDVYSIDWAEEFANPYKEDSKRTTAFGLDGNLPSNVKGLNEPSNK